MTQRTSAGRLLLGRVLGVSAQLSAAGLLLTSAWLIVRAAEHPPVLFLMVAIVGVRFFGVARTVLRYAERLVLHDVALHRVVELRVRVLEVLEQRAGQLADATQRGDLVRRVVSDVDAVQDRLLRVRGPWIVAIATTVVTAAVLAWILPIAGAVLVAGAGSAMLLVRLTGGDAATESLTAARAALAAEASNEAVAAPDLVVAGATSGRLLTVQVERIAELERHSARRSGLAQSLVLMCTAAALGALALLSGDLEPVMVGVVVLAPLALAEPLEALADAERFRRDVEAAEQRLRTLLAAGAAVPDPTFPAMLPEASLPGACDLRLEGVAIGRSVPLVSGIDLDLAAGSAVAVTGPSGVGKSTLGLTLTRFLEPMAGRIVLGGVDVTTLTGADVRSRIGLLSQDEMVFDTTVRENLRIADPSAGDDRMMRALDDAGLGSWLASTRDGLDTRVGERGSALSGGERQRLCLARLLLAGHRILVLDEPTEHLDDSAAERLLADLLALRPRVSLVVISHDQRVIDAVGHRLDLESAAQPQEREALTVG